MGNFIKATFDALSRTYGFLTPELWRETRFSKPPAQARTRTRAPPAAAGSGAACGGAVPRVGGVSCCFGCIFLVAQEFTDFLSAKPKHHSYEKRVDADY